MFSLSIQAEDMQPQGNTTEVDSATHKRITDVAENNSLYPASFFDQYTPQNAMEMIQRLPGFSFDGGSNSRGFGGSAGNVLINGARPTSKSGGLEDALQRIPASQVLHIEIIRGGISAGEAAGQTIVANVVKKDITTSGTWTVAGVRSENAVVKPQIEASIAMKMGEWDTSFDSKLGAQPEYRNVDITYLDADEILLSNTDETRDTLEEYLTFNGEGARKLFGGTFTINTALNTNLWQNDIERQTYNATSNSTQPPDKYWLLNEKEEVFDSELGLDWVSIISDWKLRIIALTASNDLQYENTKYAEFNNVQPPNTSQFTQDSLEVEHIARITFGKTGSGKFKPELGVEIANNRLDTELSLIDNGVPQELEGANAVEELRGEIFANFSYLVQTDLSLEGGLTAEFSKIEAYSDVTKSQTLNFIKPRFSANYTFNESATLTFVAEHTVEQLDFNDFAASSNSSDDRTTSGNDSLQPEQATSFSTIYDWRFSERGNLNIEAVYEQRQDVHEQILLPSGNQGLGNAGDADFWYVKTNVSLPVDAILENGLLEIFYGYKDAKFYDPIINDHRVIYDFIPHELVIDFRQDLLQYDFSWGMQYIHHYKKTKYYVDEIQTNTGNNFLHSLFIETTKFFNIKTRLEINDVNTAEFTRSRYFYLNDRSGEFEGSAITNIFREPEITLSFSGTF